MSDISTDELVEKEKEKNGVLLFLNSQEDITIANKLIESLGGFLAAWWPAFLLQRAPPHRLLLRASWWLCPGGTSQACRAHLGYLGWSGSCGQAQVGGKLGGGVPSPHHLLGERTPSVASIPYPVLDTCPLSEGVAGWLLL